MLVFISFKLEETAVVRPVVDLLLGQGVDVWFCEYEVHGRDWSEIKPIIDQGLETATHAVLFESPRYADSEHCRDYEALDLLEKIGNPEEQIVRVDMGGSSAMDTHLPGLTACRRIESEAPRKIVETLATAWRLPGGIVAPAWRATAPTQVATDFPLATFDSSGLQIETRTRHRDGVEDVGLTALDSDMHFMTHFTALQRGLAASEGFQFPKISPDSLAGDEWKAYCEAREAYLGQEQSHARDYLESNSQLLPGANHIGFHLVALGPNIHFAISYEVKGSWRRKYSLLVDHPEHGPMELVYTFAVRGSRQQFHSLAPWMDHIVQSTSLEPEGITTAPRKGGGLGRWLLLAAGVGGSLWWFLT